MSTIDQHVSNIIVFNVWWDLADKILFEYSLIYLFIFASHVMRLYNIIFTWRFLNIFNSHASKWLFSTNHPNTTSINKCKCVMFNYSDYCYSRVWPCWWGASAMQSGMYRPEYINWLKNDGFQNLLTREICVLSFYFLLLKYIQEMSKTRKGLITSSYS